MVLSMIYIQKNLLLKPGGGRVLIPTGMFIELPMGYELQIRPRSGLASKHGIKYSEFPGYRRLLY